LTLAKRQKSKGLGMKAKELLKKIGQATEDVELSQVIKSLNKRTKQVKKGFKQNQIVIARTEMTDPMLSKGEVVVYLGEIPNMPGHCIIATHSGQVVWGLHPENFREPKEDEI
jgi:hypothetical protein